MKDKLTRKKLLKRLSTIVKDEKIPLTSLERIINTILGLIGDYMIQGKPIEFRELGSFKSVFYQEKEGRSPKDPSKIIYIPPKRVVKFKMSKYINEEINGKK